MDTTTNAKGIDVFHGDGPVDWQQAKDRGGITFGIAKSSEGISYADSAFPAHWANMARAGVLRGAYHFFRPAQDAGTQARHFVDVLNSVGGLLATDLPPVLDVETFDGVPQARVIQGVRAWCQTVHDLTGRIPIIYTTPLGGFLDNSFGDYPLWVADPSGKPAPRLPMGWQDWVIWQTAFGEQGGHIVPGCASSLDIDWAFGTLDQLRQRLGIPAPGVQETWSLILPGGNTVSPLGQCDSDPNHNYIPGRAFLGNYLRPSIVTAYFALSPDEKTILWNGKTMKTKDGSDTPIPFYRDANGTVWVQIAAIASWLGYELERDLKNFTIKLVTPTA